VKVLSSVSKTIDSLAIDQHHQEIHYQLCGGCPIEEVPQSSLPYDKLSIVKEKISRGSTLVVTVKLKDSSSVKRLETNTKCKFIKTITNMQCGI
jgi:hypothetical protein